MDDHHHGCPQQLRSSCSSVEPHICITSADTAAYDPTVDFDFCQSKESLFQSLYHQVFPQHHFTKQRHEGKDRCLALRLSVHRHHRHGLPSRMGERAFVAIDGCSKTLLSKSSLKTLNICSYFHPRHPIHGTCRGLFIWFHVTLWSRNLKTKRL